MIPKKFQCMGFTVPVKVGRMKDSTADGHYHGREPRIVISDGATKQVQEQTFWHEYVHCALTVLGYEEMNSNEQFVDQFAQCLYQLEKTRTNA